MRRRAFLAMVAWCVIGGAVACAQMIETLPRPHSNASGVVAPEAIPPGTPQPQNFSAGQGWTVAYAPPTTAVAQAEPATELAEAECFQECSIPVWTASVAAIFLSHEGDDRALYRNNNGGGVALSMEDLDLGFQAGPRVNLFRHLGAAHRIEAIYFGVFDWSAEANLTGGPRTHENLLGFSVADVFGVTATYEADLQSFELNYRAYDWLGGLGLLVGVRCLQLEESFRLTNEFDNQLGAQGTDRFSLSADNHLVGPQIGIDAVYETWNWRLSARAKAALFNNDMELSGRADVPQIVGRAAGESFDISANEVAWLGEFNFDAVWQLTPDWALFLGSQIMLFDGVATAPGQIDGPNLNGDPNFYGGIVGLELYR